MFQRRTGQTSVRVLSAQFKLFSALPCIGGSFNHSFSQNINKKNEGKAEQMNLLHVRTPIYDATKEPRKMCKWNNGYTVENR